MPEMLSLSASSSRRKYFLPLSQLAVGALVTALVAVSALSAQSAPRITQSVDTTRLSMLPHHHPDWANPGNGGAALPPDQTVAPMTLVLQRSPEQELAFQSLLADQQNPASPEYHHWLTPAEVGERFGLATQDIDALSGWLQSQGLNVNWVSPSRVFISFGGTAANVNRAFHTELRSYQVNGEDRISVSSDPVIPSAVLPAIKAIHGLYTIDEQPALHMASGQSSVPAFDSNSGNHYIAPADFVTLYDLPPSLTGAGQTIGIVDRSRTNFADFANYRALTGSTFPNPIEIIPTAFGGKDPGPAATTCTVTPCTAPSGQGEATLDVLRAGSTAPGAKLLLVVDTSASGDIETDMQYLVQTSPTPAQIVTLSYSDCEPKAGAAGVGIWDTLFQQAASEGISVFVSSGDSGANSCDTHGDALPPANPLPISGSGICASSYATCVGGTEFNEAQGTSFYWNSSNGLYLSSVLSYIPEGAWNQPLDSLEKPEVGASGGGVSAFIPTPAWQTGAGVPSARTGRYTPDIAFSAAGHDSYFSCFAAEGNGCVPDSTGHYNFEAFYGTSAAAPSMAGIAALLDQKEGGAQGNLNPQLYQMAARAPAAFHDVTVASSGVQGCDVTIPSMCNNSLPSTTGLTGGQTGYLVNPGYDEVTGLGSLDVQAFIDNFLTGSSTTPTVTVSGTVVSVLPGASSGNTSTITVTPAYGFTGNVVLTAAITSSPSGAQYLPTLSLGSTGTVNITGAAAGTATLTVSTTAPGQSAASSSPRTLPWQGIGGALACLLLFGVPVRRRSLPTLLGVLGLLVLAAGGMTGCGGSGGGGAGSAATFAPGTTAGLYTVTVTCSSAGSVLSTGTLTVNVQ